MAKRSSKGSGAGKILLGAALGAGAAIAGGYLYLHPEVLSGGKGGAVAGSYPGADSVQETSHPSSPAPRPKFPATPMEVAPPNKAAMAEGQPPFAASEDVFEAAAPTYRKHCAACHGSPGQSSKKGSPAPQFWSANAPDMTRKPPSAIYTVIAKGPGHAFAGKLSSTQMWQLTLLLREAGHELPDPVRNLMGE